jgi:hypothetical protein
MTRKREIALICQINAGGFSGERVAEVTLVNGSTQKVLAPRHYCWTKDNNPLTPTQPELGTSIEGLVAARIIKENGGKLVVTTPDGEVFEVSSDTVQSRPTTSEITPHVPV